MQVFIDFAGDPQTSLDYSTNENLMDFQSASNLVIQPLDFPSRLLAGSPMDHHLNDNVARRFQGGKSLNPEFM